MTSKIADFDWDEGNWPKCAKHGMTKSEIEEVFENEPTLYRDPEAAEERLRAIGKTLSGRYAFIVFTLRDRGGKAHIRPISARFMHEREIRQYEQG